MSEAHRCLKIRVAPEGGGCVCNLECGVVRGEESVAGQDGREVHLGPVELEHRGEEAFL